MEQIYKDKLVAFRKRFPVGIRQALKLLEITGGDLEKSVELFKEHHLEIVLSKTGVSKDFATRHLLKNNYDIYLTLKSIDEERYTFTERVLIKNKNHKEWALNVIALRLSELNDIKSNFWLNFDDICKQPPIISCILAVMEWLNYESWENLDCALCFHLDIVIDKINDHLSFPEIIEVLKTAKKIHSEQFEEQQAKLKREGSKGPTPEFLEQSELFDIQRPILIDKLYELVQKNIECFP